VAEDLTIAGYLSKPTTAQALLDGISAISGVRDVLVIDDDRGFVCWWSAFCKPAARVTSYAARRRPAGI